MADSIEIHLRDIGRVLVDAWRRELEGIDSVTISCGDIFSTKAGLIKPGDPIEVSADAIVSPANSFGFMDGGIDALYARKRCARQMRAAWDRVLGDASGTFGSIRAAENDEGELLR